ALDFLDTAYGEQKRRLGPLAVLHPIRAAALLVRAEEAPAPLDLLATLFHDKNEDITPERYGRETWDMLEERYREIIGRRGGDAALLDERLAGLTRAGREPYHQYLGRLIQEAGHQPALVKIKLADRLDNTLDLRIDLSDPTRVLDCNQVIFEALFVGSYRGVELRQPHPAGRKINGAMRLYQLYKNAVFLSLLRDQKAVLDAAGRKLFSSLALASIAEGKSTMLHLFAYHLRDPREQQDLLKSVMSYSAAGGLQHINLGEGHQLDGLFKRRFDRETKSERRQSLQELYRDKRLMGETAVAFIVIFTNFLNDPGYTIKGISANGLAPQERAAV
ncbi:MAG: hypothetical protein M0017_09965, partial [Desulfobacteraceae bacterium]|nr:hypothetical protein [Desulfobacteraceae bacterium]